MTFWTDMPDPEPFWHDVAPEPFWKDAPPRPEVHGAVAAVGASAAPVERTRRASIGRGGRGPRWSRSRSSDPEATPPRSRSTRPARPRSCAAQPRVIPAEWVRTLPDWPALTVTAPGQDRESIVIGDDHVYSVALRTGALRWTTPMADIDAAAARSAATRSW